MCLCVGEREGIERRRKWKMREKEKICVRTFVFFVDNALSLRNWKAKGTLRRLFSVFFLRSLYIFPTVFFLSFLMFQMIWFSCTDLYIHEWMYICFIDFYTQTNKITSTDTKFSSALCVYLLCWLSNQFQSVNSCYLRRANKLNIAYVQTWAASDLYLTFICTQFKTRCRFIGKYICPFGCILWAQTNTKRNAFYSESMCQVVTCNV